jgi:predicted AAA+ superfamily ATPase
MDAIQYLIDKKYAKFILTGSSARKLRRGHNVNLLPGRVIVMRVDPFNINEIAHLNIPLEKLICYGSLPEILLEKNERAKEETLSSYAHIYLEEEIRAEALVRKVSLFSRFLELAASEAGSIIQFQNLSQILGVSRLTIQNYFEILEDCLIAERIEPFCPKNNTRARLSKSSKYLFFDLGIRRISAKEGAQWPLTMMGYLFEQFIGLELLRQTRLLTPAKVCYWRDHNGPEVDYVIVQDQKIIPIEVKLTEIPNNTDIKHLRTFMDLYDVKQGFIVCRTPRKMRITPNILALPWQDLKEAIAQP